MGNCSSSSAARGAPNQMPEQLQTQQRGRQEILDDVTSDHAAQRFIVQIKNNRDDTGAEVKIELFARDPSLRSG